MDEYVGPSFNNGIRISYQRDVNRLFSLRAAGLDVQVLIWFMKLGSKKLMVVSGSIDSFLASHLRSV